METSVTKHQASVEDVAYWQAFQTCQVDAATFHHREHLRLAYTLLVNQPMEAACDDLKQAILSFLQHLGVSSAKYHETLTYGWLCLAQHAMSQTAPCASAEAFLQQHPELLDKEAIHRYYSTDLLQSEWAKSSRCEADLQSFAQT